MVFKLAVLGSLAATLAAAPLAALAQSKAQAHTYRCVSKDGKKYYGQTIPRACLGQPIEALSAQGTVLYRVDPEGDEKQRQQKEAEAAKKREEDAAAKEESRRNRALLATYTSAADIEDARARALADNAKLVKEVEGRIDAIKKRQAGYAKEMEFYSEGKSKAKTSAKPPAKLLEDVRTAEVDLKLQEQALVERKKQVEVINAKYDEDKRRFQALTKGR
ncbi:MAG TPA: hypothetical protein VEB41_16210 [Burkholderiales bacterium]|nr:hypothetical protein [Burkholderiales bacterium]